MLFNYSGIFIRHGKSYFYKTDFFLQIAYRKLYTIKQLFSCTQNDSILFFVCDINYKFVIKDESEL